MAEALVFEIAKIFLEKPISGAVQEACSALHIKSHIESLEKTKFILEAWLLDADVPQLTSCAQRLALEQLGCILEKLHDFLDVRAARAMRRQIISRSPIKKVFSLFSPSSNPIVCAFRDAREVKALIEELDRIARKHNQLGCMLRLSSEPVSQMQTLTLEKGPFTSEEVIERDKDRDNIIRMLLKSSDSCETFSMVSIVGIGGMGKTTLAQYVFNDDSVKGHFDVRLWVYVPQVLIAKDVVQNMVAFSTSEVFLQCGMPQLQHHLLLQITGKKILLVLDNVWDHVHLSLHWEELRKLIGFSGAGSMVLTTTRSAGVAKTIGIVDPYMLMGLAADDSWHLFRRVSFTRCQEPGLEAVGKEIAHMCPNVPLVISSIGHHLKGMHTIGEWMDFKEKLTHLSSCGQVPSIMHILKLSYDQLDPKLKLCFAYCSLFPKGCLFKRKLISLWIALGYVESQSGNQSLVDIVEDNILHLKDRGFFLYQQNQNVNRLRMHDVIHDLALFVAGSKYKKVDSETNEFDYERIRHVSFLRDETELSNEDLPCFLLFKVQKKLLSLLVSSYDYVAISKLDLSKFECLTVLSLEHVGLTEVPRTIGKLISLRYLDLSRNYFSKLPYSITRLVNLVSLDLSLCRELQELPRDLNRLEKLLLLDLSYCGQLQKLPCGISKLTNLLSLDVVFCSLGELPRDMSKLVKLRELRLYGCKNLRHMPFGFGNMTGLQTLDLFVARGRSSCSANPNNSNDSDDDYVGGVAELNCLNNLKGELTIVVDGNWSSESEAKAANLQGKEKLIHLCIGFVGGSSRDNEIMLESFQRHTNLRSLQIGGYGGKSLPSWIDNKNYLFNLEKIVISTWEACVCLGSLGRLPLLKIVKIGGLPNLEYLENTAIGSSSNNIMDVDEGANSDLDSNALSTPLLFPSLEELSLERLPKLKG